MKRVFGQTVRDIKREVNKKVLKLPGIEMKVLDATSNEPWGPHGSHLADIAQATRNYNEYQMIMAVIWKRINDTGKNWRHVYKALTVLEYLVAHGSERVIDDVKEHTYQISTLSDFQYIDASGRDQGSNVRKKSQSLVALLNDRERIHEVRQKALANRDKYLAPSAGAMYRPSSFSGGSGNRYDEDRYGEERNGYGREQEWGMRSDDHNSRGGDRYGRDGDDRYGRHGDDQYGRDGYRDDDYRGTRGSESYKSRSNDCGRERDRPYDDDDLYASRSGGGRAEEQSPDERQFERKLSQSIGAPPSHDKAVNGTITSDQDERDGGPPVPQTPSPSANSPPAPKVSSPFETSPSVPKPSFAAVVPDGNVPPVSKVAEAFDEFDPRASVQAPGPAATNAEADIFGLSDINALALFPVSPTGTCEVGVTANADSGSNFVPLSSASTVLDQPTEDPFGDGPFRALPSDYNIVSQNQGFAAPEPMPTTSVTSGQLAAAPDVATVSNFEFADTFQGVAYAPEASNIQFTGATDQPVPTPHLPAPQSDNDILGGILSQTGPPTTLSAMAPASLYAPPSGVLSTVSPLAHSYAPTMGTLSSVSPLAHLYAPPSGTLSSVSPPAPSYAPPSGTSTSVSPHGATSSPYGLVTPYSSSMPPYVATAGNVGALAAYGSSAPPPASNSSSGSVASSDTQAPPQAPAAQLGPTTVVSFPPDPAGHLNPAAPIASCALPASSEAAQQPSISQQLSTQQPKDKFETKSTVWADTLNRGLVNLNISGPKINPLADIGIDFDSINRQEKRREKEKNSPSSVTSTTIMGKAMGFGSGIGRAGASGLAPPLNPMMGAGIGMGMGGAPGMGMGGPGMGMGMGIGGPGMGMGMGMGMGNYGGINQTMIGMGMGMNMGLAQGAPTRPPLVPGVPGYNPMMSTNGGYNSQQPYGGYRSG